MNLQKPVIHLKDSIKIKPKGFNFMVNIKSIKHTPLNHDTTKFVTRHFNGKALKNLLQDPEFDYYQEKADTGSWWDNFWRWFFHMLENLFGHPQKQSSSTPYTTYLVVVIVLCIIVVAIVRFARKNSINIFSSAVQQINDADTTSLENIHEITFDEEIESALSQGYYRLAVRLLYLRSLKQLNDAGLIVWKAEKTNSAYLYELKDPEQYQQFKVITRQFEYVWYGEFPLNGESFKNIQRLFNHFKQTVV